MKYKIIYDINDLKYSNTQKKIGYEFSDKTKSLATLST